MIWKIKFKLWMDIFTHLLIMGLVCMGICFMLDSWINLLEETNSYIRFRSLWNSLSMFCTWLFPISSYYVSKSSLLAHTNSMSITLYEYFSVNESTETWLVICEGDWQQTVPPFCAKQLGQSSFDGNRGQWLTRNVAGGTGFMLSSDSWLSSWFVLWFYRSMRCVSVE